MARFLIVATAGAGGDLPPLAAASLALRDRGHDTIFIGDAAVQRILGPLHIDVDILPKELDLGPRLAGLVQAAMQATGGDLAKAGPLLQRGMTVWAHDVAEPVSTLIDRHRPAAIVTSLFGVEAIDATCPTFPWAVVNSTFYIGPNPPRPVEEDIGPRALPLIKRYADLLEAADLVLHATDQAFDYGFTGLPSRHQYVGPLGIWEPPQPRPTFLDEPGAPWILVSISSQRQDDIKLADAALEALADQPVRVLVTLGPEHERSELARHPQNARIEKTVSHSAVLERAVLLVGHAGHGTVMKALWQESRWCSSRGAAISRVSPPARGHSAWPSSCPPRKRPPQPSAMPSRGCWPTMQWVASRHYTPLDCGQKTPGKCGDADRVSGRRGETGTNSLAACRQPARPRRFIASNGIVLP